MSITIFTINTVNTTPTIYDTQHMTVYIAQRTLLVFSGDKEEEKKNNNHQTNKQKIN